MRNLFFAGTIIIALFLVSFIPKKTAVNCKTIHKGIFYFYPKNSTKKYIAIRDGIIQKEIAIGNIDTAIYKINWMDDCTYKLDYISGGAKIPEGMKRPNLVVQFTTIETNYYLFKACLDSLNSKYCFNDTIWMSPK